MRLRLQAYLVLILATLSPVSVHADGGMVIMRKEVDALIITVFASPAPLSVGPADISVLVQNRDGLQPLLDAQVSVLLQGQSSTAEIRARATREQAQNKLLYAALLTIPEPGKWRLLITTLHHGNHVKIGHDIDVNQGDSARRSDWEYIALPIITVAVFVIRECLMRRRYSLRVRKCETI